MSFEDYMGAIGQGTVSPPAESRSVELGFAPTNVRTSIENDRRAPSPLVGTDDGQQVISFEEFIASSPVESQLIELGFASTNVQTGLKNGRRTSSDGNQQVISLESFVAGPSRKRARVDDMLNSDDENPEPKKITKARRARCTRAVGVLREIIGREGMGPIYYRQLAKKIQVPVNLLDLFQMSPDLSKAFRKLSTRVNVKSKGKAAAAAVESVESTPSIPVVSGPVSENVHKVSATSNLVLSQPLMPRLGPNEKAFGVPAVVKARRSGDVIKQISLPASTTKVDQGSELNLISIGLVKAMHYKPISLSSKGFSGLTMNTADGGSSALTHFVTFWLSVLGI
jgi:hypothetical protein